MTAYRPTLAEINAMPADRFTQVLGGVFEDAPWVAEGTAPGRPFSSVGVLHDAMCAVVRQAPTDRQDALIRNHPDLAGKAARDGALTAASAGEQRGAGLDRLTEAEYARFDRLNTAYRERFAMPFVVAVKGLTKHDILAAMEARLANDAAAERQAALTQIFRIARFRLADLVRDDA